VNLKLNKGQYTIGHKWLYYVIALFLITIMVLFFRGEIQGKMIDSTLCLEDVEKQLIVTETLYSPDCFAYFDEELQRTFPGIIDLSKFNQETFDSCFKYIDQDVKLEIGEIIVGDNLTSKDSETKLIQVYDEGNITTDKITFHYPEPLC